MNQAKIIRKTNPPAHCFELGQIVTVKKTCDTSPDYSTYECTDNINTQIVNKNDLLFIKNTPKFLLLRAIAQAVEELS
jgi:hypothetical protein